MRLYEEHLALLHIVGATSTHNYKQIN